MRRSRHSTIAPRLSHPSIKLSNLKATDLIESDIDYLLKEDAELEDESLHKLTFKTYGKSETELIFRRILYSAKSEDEPQRTNYVQCRACAKLLVAKLTGGSNPARHKKHCKGNQPLNWTPNSTQSRSTHLLCKRGDNKPGPFKNAMFRSVNHMSSSSKASTNDPVPSFVQLIDFVNQFKDSDNEAFNQRDGSFDFHTIVQRKLNNQNISDALKLQIFQTRMHPSEKCANRGFNIKRLDSEELQFVAYSEEDDGFYCKSCVLFSFREGRFVSRPFCFFKAFFSAGNGWPKHAKSKYHKDATRTTIDFIHPHHNASNTSNEENGSKEFTDFLTTYAKALVDLEAINDNGTNNQRSPSRESSTSNNGQQEFEMPALTAYRIRQTYIFMRVLKTDKPILCKANDEDFFPPHRTHTTASERANWTAGQIVTAYLDFDQKETECAIELVGDREEVQEYFQDVIVKEAMTHKAVNESADGQNEDGLSSTVRKLIFPDLPTRNEVKQNGHSHSTNVDMEETDPIPPWELSNTDSLLPPPSKLPRLDPTSLNNDSIVRRFEKLEERIRFVEKQQILMQHKRRNSDQLDDSIQVLIGNKRTPLKTVSLDALRSEINAKRTQIMESDSLVVNDENLYRKFIRSDLADELRSGTLEFGSNVLSLLIDSETFRKCYIPSLTEANICNGVSDLRALNPEVIEVYKKLLLFLGGSVICPDNYNTWLGEIRVSLQKEFIYPIVECEPIYNEETALMSKHDSSVLSEHSL